jgi:hypothetical protein
MPGCAAAAAARAALRRAGRVTLACCNAILRRVLELHGSRASGSRTRALVRAPWPVRLTRKLSAPRTAAAAA